jgi:ATP synthase F1 delta subunit
VGGSQAQPHLAEMASLVARSFRAVAAGAVRSQAGSMALRATAASVRYMSAKKQDGNMTSQDITKYFMEMDAASPAVAASELPIKLTGRSGELVAQLYASTKGSKGAFDKAVKELEGIVAAVERAGIVVDRFFQTQNYSENECKKVVDLLLTNKEPLTSFDGIKDAEVKDILVDNAGNLEVWSGVRKAIAALAPSAEVKAVMDGLATSARLDLVKKVAAKAAELRNVTSKVTDAVVTSAVPLTKEQQAAVSKALPQYATAGTSVNVTYTVDPAVLGGLLVTFKNQTIDLSAATRLVEVVSSMRGSEKASQ